MINRRSVPALHRACLHQRNQPGRKEPGGIWRPCPLKTDMTGFRHRRGAANRTRSLPSLKGPALRGNGKVWDRVVLCCTYQAFTHRLVMAGGADHCKSRHLFKFNESASLRTVPDRPQSDLLFLSRLPTPGTIPAWAGEPRRRPAPHSLRRAHPRVGGGTTGIGEPIGYLQRAGRWSAAMSAL
jgi:hypothetical protein